MTVSLICPDCFTDLPGSEIRCSACGWQGAEERPIRILLSRRDRDDPVFRAYQRNYDAIAAADVAGGIIDERYVRNLAASVVAELGTVDGLDVCDVGSGKGFVVGALADQGARTLTAVDISAQLLRIVAANPRIDCILANAENLPFRRCFDVIIATDVLEHVLNAGSLLHSMNRALRMGGRLVVRVPHRESLMPYAPEQGCAYRFVHLRSFDRPILRDYLRDAGMRAESFRFDGYFPGRPRPFWMASPLRMKIYALFQRARGKFLESEFDATRMPAWLAGVFMQAPTVVAVARKVADIERPQGARMPP
jgi:SAM-dependent methyltransferase